MVSSSDFRQAMSRLSAAVHVVTTDGPYGRLGFTATAVCSVSDDPPTLLVCVNRKLRAGAAIQGNEVLCINVLRAEESDVADTFAGRTDMVSGSRFDIGQWSNSRTGAPVLRSSLISLECSISEVKPVASHDIFFGTVEAIHYGESGAAMVYFDRHYNAVRGAA